MTELLTKIGALLGLKDDWDSYGAPRISGEAVNAAIAFVENLQAVPTVRGGIQLESHTDSGSFEIAFGADGSIVGISLEKP